MKKQLRFNPALTTRRRKSTTSCLSVGRASITSPKLIGPQRNPSSSRYKLSPTRANGAVMRVSGRLRRGGIMTVRVGSSLSITMVFIPFLSLPDRLSSFLQLQQSPYSSTLGGQEPKEATPCLSVSPRESAFWRDISDIWKRPCEKCSTSFQRTIGAQTVSPRVMLRTAEMISLADARSEG